MASALLWGAKASETDMERIRVNYVKAASDKKVCGAMIDELSETHRSPLHQAYLGGFKAIWAKHAFNPFAKLATFNKGKKYIEQAVSEDPQNVEIRFIRLSVQKNCPSFLGYDSQIEKDRQFIVANRGSVTSAQLKKMLEDIR
ncbi:hypothetical protein [Pedobacter sp. ASV12]|uniref:hypothetical protein n=1 Tax=Pedobacter sp. ASV12 TaxID=2795120 RepID=UPI00351C1F2B